MTATHNLYFEFRRLKKKKGQTRLMIHMAKKEKNRHYKCSVPEIQRFPCRRKKANKACLAYRWPRGPCPALVVTYK